jgi:hypothetical protein
MSISCCLIASSPYSCTSHQSFAAAACHFPRLDVAFIMCESASHSNPLLPPEQSSKASSNKPPMTSTSRTCPNKQVWSSGVAFHPNGRYWRIGPHWYDFEPFLSIHPGGREILSLARDRFDDATYAFESHHMNYNRARAIIKKYRLPDSQSEELTRNHSVQQTIKLLDDKAFYSVLRTKVVKHFKDSGQSFGPTLQCLTLFWIVFFSWVGSVGFTLWSGSFGAAVLQGVMASFLGAFGHNWVHQPKYKWMVRKKEG